MNLRKYVEYLTLKKKIGNVINNITTITVLRKLNDEMDRPIFE